MSQEPRLTGMLPGALMYRVEPPNGIPQTEIDITRQVRCLASSPVFAGVCEAERQALIESIANTIGRAEYHFQRFRAQRETLEQIRAWAPGDVFWDAAGSAVHYELQALAGAARLLVDEMLFLTAKRYSQRDWQAVPIVRDPIAPGSAIDVPEVHRLRAHRDWFELLNAYRNTFFHRGWKHGSGHFDCDERKAAQHPGMNALLVPDQESLTSRSRPHEWTYKNRRTVDEVAARIHDGVIELVGELCAIEWGTPVPLPGRIPDADRPNLIVSLPIPVLLTIRETLVVPVFSSKERALTLTKSLPALSARVATGDYELRAIPSCEVGGNESISLSFTQLEPSESSVKELYICLDPEPQDEEWRLVNASSHVCVPLSELLADPIRIVAIPVEPAITAYVWCTPFLTP